MGALLLFQVSRAEAQGFVGLGKREGFVEFGAEATSANSSLAGIDDFSSGQRRFSERVGLRGDLFLLDESFFDLNYGLTFNFSQDSITNEEAAEAGSGRLVSYNLEASLFPKKPYLLTLFANRSSSINLRDFGGSSELLTTNQGAALSLKSLFLPSTVSYRQELSSEDSRFASLIGSRKERRKTFTYDGRNHWGAQDLGLHYEWTAVRDLITPSLSYRTQTAGTTHRYRFGEEQHGSLNFNLNYALRRDDRGLSSSVLTAIEDLDLQHGKSFSTGYHYILSRFTGLGGETTSHTGAISLQHRLYDSLRTALTLHATHSTLTNGMQRLYGGRWNTDYRKKLRAKGVLLAALGGRYDIENDLIEGKTIPVFQEQHVARIGIPFRLNQPRVLQATVSVSGANGTIVFQEGLDYLLRLVGNFTEVEVLPSGRIREGEILIVDYEIIAPPVLKFSTFTTIFNIGPDFGWFYPYYGFERNRQRLLFGVDSGSLEDLRAHTAGVRFRWDAHKFSALLLNEFRSQDSRLLPYRSLQFSQVLTYTPKHTITIGVNLDEVLSHYTKPDRETQSGVGRLSVAWSPLPSVTVDTFVALRLWRDSIAVDENFQQSGVRLRWFTRKFTAALHVDQDERVRDRLRVHEFRWYASILRRF